MVDNVTADAGSGGATFAADDIGGVHYPRTKLVVGADGTNDGDVASGNPLPVDVIAALPAGTAAIGKLAANSGVDIGDVDVTSQIPGTAATNLGKAIDTAVGATDTGVAMLAKHAAAAARLATAENDYDGPRLSEFGALLTEPEQHLIIDDMDNLAGFGGTWAAITNDTTGIASSTKHVLGSASIEFDKVNGAADSQIGGITKALTAVNLDGASPHDILQTVVYVGATTEIDDGSSYFFLRLGTDATDYNEWRIPGTEFTAGIWEAVAMEIGDASFAGQGGAGITWSAITYIAVGFFFDDVDDTLANIYVDEISFHTNQHVNAAINAEITSSISTANINLAKVAGSPATKSSGNVGAGTQRVTLATDDVNAAAIKTATELLDDVVHVDDAAFTLGSDKGAMIMGFAGAQSVDSGDAAALACTTSGILHTQDAATLAAISGSEFQVDVVAALPAGTNGIGKLTANSGVDIGDVDILSIAAGDNNIGNVDIVSGVITTVSALGVGTTGPQKAEDIASANGDMGIAVMARRTATPADTSGADLDYEMLQMDNGRLWTATTVSGTVTVDGSGVTQPVSGTVTANAGTNLNTSALLTTTAHDAAFGTAGSADAQVRTVQGVASMTPLLVDATGQGDVPITLNGEAVVLGAGTAEIGKLAAGTAGIGKLTANDGVDIGDVDVTSISAGANLVGDVGLSGARTSGGTTPYKNIDVDETEDEVKGSAGQIFWIHCVNLASSVLFLKIYNEVAASVSVGTTVPDLTFPIPTQGDTNGAGFTLSIPNGIALGTGITVAATTGIADNDAGAPGANEVVLNLGFA